jgi:hypothetical protein
MPFFEFFNKVTNIKYKRFTIKYFKSLLLIFIIINNISFKAIFI